MAGDFNGDGKLDLAVSNAFSAIVPAGARGTLVMEEFGTFSILPGNGDGTFQAPQEPALPQDSSLMQTPTRSSRPSRCPAATSWP